MAKTDETNAKADRARLGKVLSDVPQPNRATRRKIEAQGDAVAVTLSDLPSLQEDVPTPSEPEFAAATKADEQDQSAVPEIPIVQSDIVAAPDGDSSPAEGTSDASAPLVSVRGGVSARKAVVADAPATQPTIPTSAELDASALEATTPVSLNEPALGADSAWPYAAILQSNFPVFSIKDMTMDMSTNFAGFQTAMTEAQAKAKAAFEKSSTAMGEVGEFTKGNVEAVIQSGKIFAEGCQEIGSTIAAESRTAFEAMTGDIKELAAAKSPTDFLKIQSDMLRKSFDNAVAYSSKNSETFLKLMSDAAAPLSGRVSMAVEKVRQTTASASATV